MLVSPGWSRDSCRINRRRLGDAIYKLGCCILPPTRPRALPGLQMPGPSALNVIVDGYLPRVHRRTIAPGLPSTLIELRVVPVPPESFPSVSLATIGFYSARNPPPHSRQTFRRFSSPTGEYLRSNLLNISWPPRGVECPPSFFLEDFRGGEEIRYWGGVQRGSRPLTHFLWNFSDVSCKECRSKL